MPKSYLKPKQIIAALQKGAEIYTSRDEVTGSKGQTVYSALHYELWEDAKMLGFIHHATISNMIANKIISGRDSKQKYKYINPTLNSINAKQIHDYFILYRRYLTDHNLADDSKTISVEDLINFVDDHLSDDDEEE